MCNEYAGKVSIVLPTYNGERYISESIDSILKQIYQNWELIIVDDCSTDGTLQIIKKYAETDNRISIIHNDVNQMIARSLNIGFNKATGEYLTWTSDDNVYLSNAINIMRKYLYENDYIMVCAGANIIDINGKVIQRYPIYNEYAMLVHNTIGACFMYKRKVLQMVGKYDPSTYLVEDFDYWQRILKISGHIGYINDVLYLYRRHRDTLSITKQKEVAYQFAKLQEKNINQIFKIYRYDKNVLCHVYYNFVVYKSEYNNLLQQLLGFLPELKREIRSYLPNRNYIVFGAGDYGRRAFNLLNGNVKCFIDNNKSKIGKKINGLLINSLTDILPLAKTDIILIAVGNDKIYSIVKQLLNNGINEFSTYRTLWFQISNNKN